MRHTSSFLLLALALTGMTLPLEQAAAADLDSYQKQEFEADGGKLLYRSFKPAKIEAGKKYPLILFLHGAGERGDDNTRQLVHGCSDFVSDAVQGKQACFVIAPQCPSEQKWVDAPWSGDSHDMPGKPSPSMALTIGLLDKLVKEEPIDPSRIYVTGLSMGGFGTWDLIARQPKRFAAAIPICGGGDTATAKLIKDIPLWVFHGDADTAVKVQRSRDMVAAVKAAGGEPKYTEYPGVGHNSWSQTYSNPEVYEWLFSQQLK